MNHGVLSLLIILVALPAGAATLPPVDLVAGRFAFSAGSTYIPGATNTLGTDWSLDFGVTDQLSLGASTMAGLTLYPSESQQLRTTATVVRGTYRLGKLGVAEMGVSACVGQSETLMDYRVRFLWGQVAWNVSMPLGREDSPSRLSFTIGPLFYPGTWGRMLPPFDYAWPNLELTYRFSERLTAVIGGNSLYGIRSLF